MGDALHSRGRWVSRFLSVSVLALGCGVAFAAPSCGLAQLPSPTSPELQTRTAPLGSAATLPAPPTLSNCPFSASPIHIRLRSVTVSGGTRMKQRQIDRATKDLIGRDGPLAIACAARDRIAKLYADKGYRLTRVEIPPQRITNGDLVLTATEGYVAEVKAAGLAPLGASADLARRFLAPLAGERPTPWPDIERAVLLARDIPGAEIDIALHADPAGPGALDLIATSPSLRHLEVSTGVQNYGSHELGQVSGFARADADGFTPFGERSSLLLFGATTGGQKAVEGVESAFLGSSGLRGSVDFSYAHSTPGGQLAPLKISGDSYDGKFALSYPVVRGQALNLTTQAGFEYVDARNSLGALQGLGSAPLLFHDNLRIASVQGDLRWAPYAIPELSFGVNLELRQGIIGLGSSRKGGADLSKADGDPGAFVVRGFETVRWTFGGKPAFGRPSGPWVEAIGQQQWADRPLLASEQFQIGNYTLGRGYDPGTASGDRAYGVQLQTGWPLRAPFLGVVEPYVFYDAARVDNLTGYSSSIASWGGGARLALPWALRLDVAGAEALTPPFPGARQPASRVLISLNRNFSS
jgi:hemolysin activation/secretion protein